MSTEWYDPSNPVFLWWIFLTIVSAINIVIWVVTRTYLKKGGDLDIYPHQQGLWLSGVYVIVCAFRSVLPRADVQRICLFDTWFSSVFVGRSVATVAELCFVAQWALVLHFVSGRLDDKFVKKVALSIFPFIAIAECFSWYAVISTNYLGNAVEESIWAMTYTLIGISLIKLYPQFKGGFKKVLAVSIVGCFLYVLFMATVDVPMYVSRMMIDLSQGKEYLGFIEGIIDLNTRWIVTYDFNVWKSEIPWMSLYFSFAVWVSLGLCYVPRKLR